MCISFFMRAGRNGIPAVTDCRLTTPALHEKPHLLNEKTHFSVRVRIVVNACLDIERIAVNVGHRVCCMLHVFCKVPWKVLFPVSMSLPTSIHEVSISNLCRDSECFGCEYFIQANVLIIPWNRPRSFTAHWTLSSSCSWWMPLKRLWSIHPVDSLEHGNHLNDMHEFISLNSPVSNIKTSRLMLSRKIAFVNSENDNNARK
jgi:hypothetical protein